VPFIFLTAAALATVYIVRSRRAAASAGALRVVSQLQGAGSEARTSLVGIRGWLLLYVLGSFGHSSGRPRRMVRRIAPSSSVSVFGDVLD
jgi:hypothetical protein